MIAIETSGLRKSFGTTRALAGVDLSIRKGTVYGLLGPNGAGKTTTIRVLATLIRPDGGSARVLGHDVVRDGHEVRRKVSLTGQYASLIAVVERRGGEQVPADEVQVRLLAELLLRDRIVYPALGRELRDARGHHVLADDRRIEARAAGRARAGQRLVGAHDARWRLPGRVGVVARGTGGHIGRRAGGRGAGHRSLRRG